MPIRYCNFLRREKENIDVLSQDIFLCKIKVNNLT